MREELIHQIVDRDTRGLSMTEAGAEIGNRDFYRAACDEFGSWQVALTYAGVMLPTPGRTRYFSASRTKSQLRRLCTAGYDLSATVNRSRDRQLYDSAVNHFGTWRLALTAAGINLTNVSRRRPKQFDTDDMILWLQSLHAAGKEITFGKVCLENRDKAMAIKRTFGSWAAALQEAGLRSIR